MRRTKSLCVIAGAALSFGTVAMAQSAADVERAYAAELMADAANRTSELAQADRRFSVDVHGYFQIRYNWNRRDTADARGDRSTVGFQLARTRVNVSGNVINEDWGYFVQFGADPNGNFLLDDAYGTFRLEGGWQFQFGQFKLPFARETLLGDQYLLAADRSITEGVFGLDRSRGIMVGFTGDQIRFAGAFSNGSRQRNVDFVGNSADIGLTGRLDFKWAGDWAQDVDFTSFPNSDFFGMAGAAIHWETGGDTVNTVDQDYWALTADVSVEGNGWNVFVAGFYNSLDPAGQSRMEAWGAQAQGGIFVTPNTELFGRWDAIFPRSNWGDDNDSDFHTLTFGVNHYFAPESHAVKLTVDFMWFLDNPAETGPIGFNSPTGLSANDTLRGLLLPEGGDDQWNLRGQIQVLF